MAARFRILESLTYKKGSFWYLTPNETIKVSNGSIYGQYIHNLPWGSSAIHFMKNAGETLYRIKLGSILRNESNWMSGEVFPILEYLTKINNNLCSRQYIHVNESHGPDGFTSRNPVEIKTNHNFTLERNHKQLSSYLDLYKNPCLVLIINEKSFKGNYPTFMTIDRA